MKRASAVPPSRIATIDDVMPGKLLGHKRLRAEASHVAQYLASVEGDPALYDALGHGGAPAVPMALFATEPWGWPGAYLDYWQGGVASAMAWSASAIMLLNSEVEVTATVADRYVRRDREASVVAVSFSNGQSEVWQGQGTYSAKVDTDKVRADVERRVNAAKDVAPTGADRIVINELRFTREMSQLFWAHRLDLGSGNFHVDPLAAQALGLADVMIGSSQQLAWFSECLTALYGLNWLTAGSVDVVFRAPVVAGDRVAAALWEQGQPDTRKRKFGFEIINQRGKIVLSGNASIAA